MIKIEKVVLPSGEQWDAIIRGMRNPKNSWDKMDSSFFPPIDCTTSDDVIEGGGAFRCYTQPCTIIGPNDHDLMSKLAKGGAVHAKYRRMITVYLDITAPLYWWKEFDTYKVGTVSNSCSTMHKLTEKEFTLEDFSCEHLRTGGILALNVIIDELNKNRERYVNYDKLKYGDQYDNERKEYVKKDIWWQMIQLLPSSYNQKRTIMLDYEVLTNIYTWRKNHKLDEWQEFCKWIESLPYSELIIGPKEEKKPMTNAERIRNMSDEEMAKLFCTEEMFLWDRGDDYDIEDMANWLRAEVE